LVKDRAPEKQTARVAVTKKLDSTDTEPPVESHRRLCLKQQSRQTRRRHLG